MRHTQSAMAGVLAAMLVFGVVGDVQARRKHSSETVLVALEKGGLRSELAEKVRVLMDSRGVPVTINDYGSLDPDKANLYHAIVIIVEVKGGKPAAKVTNFLRKVPERDKDAITLAAFEKKGEWVANYHGVEAMTAMPRDIMVEALANKVVAKLDLSIEKERAEEEQTNVRRIQPPPQDNGQTE